MNQPTTLTNLRDMVAGIPLSIETKEGEPLDVNAEIKAIRVEILAKIAEAQKASAEAQKSTGTVTEELKQQLKDLQTQADALQIAIADHHGMGGNVQKSLVEEVFNHQEFKHLGEMGGRGRVTIKVDNWQQKALTNTSAGSSTSGVLSIEREPGIVSMQYRQLRIRDLLRSKPTTAAAVDYVKVSAFVNAASPQIETVAKGQSDMTLQSVSAKVVTIAHWVPVSKQAFEDIESLSETINGHLLYGLKLKEEAQLLTGSGTGEDLNGLITQATAFSTALLPASGSYNRIDVIARAIQQAERSDYTVDVIVLHTDDFWALALTKNANGDYLFGAPGAATAPRLWGRAVAISNSIGTGTFLVGSSLTALIRDRLDAVIEMSDSHADFFIANMLAIRCEERLALQVMRPGAWIKGSFTTSPA